MASCTNCGIEISEDEKKKYMGMCLTCILFQSVNKRIKPTRLFLVGTLFLTIGIFGVIVFTFAIIDEVLIFSDLSVILAGFIIYGIFLLASVAMLGAGISMVKRAVLQRKITHIDNPIEHL